MKLKNLVEKYREDMAVSADKIMVELNYKPAFDVDRGWQETVRRIYNS